MPRDTPNGGRNDPSAGVRVHFVTPDSSAADGYCALGVFSTHLPPRTGEVVTLDASLGAEPQRFRVVEVIHHMPPLGLPGQVIDDVTVLVAQICTPADLERIVASLCASSPGRRASIEQESQS